MSTEHENLDPILDRAINEIRNEQIDPAVVKAAAGRAWEKISEAAEAPAIETIRTCGDFQALIPAWREGRLAPARALLVEDHMRDCPACRKADRARKVVPFTPRPARSWWFAAPRWAVAAAVALAVGLSAYFAIERYWPVAPGSRAVVESVDGALYKMTAGAPAPVVPGAGIEEGERIRTARQGGAVIRLRDGSLVETRDRTELRISESRDGIRIRLDRGGVIVQAAKQRSRPLYVATEECLVSVTGTIFSVNHGMKGSRVAVIEGEVHVAQDGQTKVLRPGEQLSTNLSLAPVDVKEEIAWSRNADSYRALLGELSVLQQKLEAVPGPPLNYSTKLLALAPEDTGFYASMPNLGPTLGEWHRVFNEQLRDSPVLREWWTTKTKGAGDAALEMILAQVRAFSGYLGPEIVTTVSPNARGAYESPLFLAEVTRPGLEAEIHKLVPAVRIVADPAREPAPAKEQLLALLRGGFVAVSTDLAQLQRLAARIDRPGASSFPKSALYARLAEAYRNGVNWLFSADLERAVGRQQQPREVETYRRIGINDVRYLIVEHKELAGKSENRALLTFAQPRHGMMSWLAAPSPVGGLDFVSAEASLAAAFAVKEPAQMIEDLFRMLEASDANFTKGLAEFEAKSGLNVRADLARPLGGEIVLAVDGPVLPQPSWKLVLEVYDQVRFQAAIEKMVELANRESKQAGALKLEKAPAGGYVLRGIRPGVEAHYVHVDGYLVAAPSRALVDRALQIRKSGATLLRSPRFAALMPRDSQPYFSGLLYHDLGAVLGPLLGALGQGKAAQAGAPSLMLLYGGPDRIQLAGTGSFLGMSLADLLALHGPKVKRR